MINRLVRKVYKSIGAIGIGIILLITLKVFGLLKISWWIILTPLWLPFGIGFLIMLGLGILLLSNAIKKAK